MKKPKFKLKQYPHFDAPVAVKDIDSFVSDPKLVAQNPFYPFFCYQQSSIPYGSCEEKVRPIRYAARRDSYIYSYYRDILNTHYERELNKLGISDVPIAYRNIKKNNSGSGKSNIDFAKDAFDEILKQKNSIAIALDISSYFESLDHKRIYDVWSRLLGVNRLPDDHYAVYKNVTQYKYVDRNEVYCRLGFSEKTFQNGKTIFRYKVKPRDIPKKICSNNEFQEKICGKSGEFSSLITKNENNYGIPQGSPISDVIANFYLIDFDKEIFDFVVALGGKYMRYSDDMLILLPKGKVTDISELEDSLITMMEKYGNQLKIKKQKTSIVEYIDCGDRQKFNHIRGAQGKNGLEYLGFRYDGIKVFIRDKTISSFYRKISCSVSSSVDKHISNNPGKNADELIKCFKYSDFYRRFLRVKKDDFISDDYKTWSFWTYLKRAEKIFGDRGSPIFEQVSNCKMSIKKKVESKIKKKCKKNS